MKLEVTLTNILLMIGVTFFLSLIFVPVCKKIAFHIGAVDYPNQRRLNKVPMPTIGGLGIFLSFLIGYMFFGRGSTTMISILIASFIIILTGLIDDIKPISAKYQLVGQILAICTIIFYGQVTIDNFTILGVHLIFPAPLNYLVTIIFMLGIINAIDLSDGMDGLCGGISVIYFITVTVIAVLLGMAGNIDTTISILMIGAILGFLVYNFPPAKVYMGDTGSNLVGLMIAVTALYGFKLATFTSLLIPLAILGSPIIDVLFSIIRRGLKKKNPFTTPDKEHLHHQLLKMKFSTRVSVFLIYIINLLFSAVSILYALGDISYAVILYVALMIVFLFIVLKTDILFPKRKSDNSERED